MLKCLDLCCGGGGASMGISMNGIEVEGVDIKPQKEYPFKFYLANALDFPLEGYDFYFASPPCQAYSYASTQWRNKGYEYPDLIESIRERLLKTHKPFVLENVPRAPLRKDLLLCGQMFNLNVRKHRIFEIHGFYVPIIPHSKHIGKGGDGKIVYVFGHGGGKRYNYSNQNMNVWREAMGIDWIKSRDTLVECIPPAYTKYIFSFIEEQLK